jgi:molybdopterin-binding protein
MPPRLLAQRRPVLVPAGDLRGQDRRVRADGIVAEITIDIGGQKVVSTITKASNDRLGVKSGDAVVAIIAHRAAY